MNKRNLVTVFACLVALTVFSSPTLAQQGASSPAVATQGAAEDKGITPRLVFGEVTELVPAENRLTIRTDAGNNVVVAISSTTAYLRVPPGETARTNATVIAAGELAVGDRVIARGTVDTVKRAAAAREVLVMTRADLAARREREQAEWRTGVVGTVTAIDPATKQITLRPRARGVMGAPTTPVTIKADFANVIYRRYAADSVRFQDAKTSSFTELKVGDQLRARGERPAEGAPFVPKEIVSGAFRTVVGKITSVAPGGTEATLTPIAGGAPVVVRVKSDSTVRRLPEGGMMMGGMRPGMTGGAAGGGMNPGGGSPRGERPQGAAPQGAGRGQGTAPAGAPGGMGGGMGAARGGFDIGEMIERLPQLTLSDLKPGDTVIVSSTATSDTSQMTAIALVAGVERFLAMMQNAAPQQGGNRPGGQSLGTGLPGGFDLGIGGP